MITCVRVSLYAEIPEEWPETATWYEEQTGHTYLFFDGVSAPQSIARGIDIIDDGPAPPTRQKRAKLPLALRTMRDPTKTVLIPGEHVEGSGRSVEQGTHEFAAAALRALPKDSLYRWDRIVGEIVGDQFRALSTDRARLLVDRSVRCARWKGKPPSRKMAYVPCNKDLAGLVVSAAESSPDVRPLRMITRYPVYGPGFIRAKPGWNPETGILYIEPPELVGIEPQTPDMMTLLDLIVDFPFRDPMSDRINLVGLMLTILLRPCFPTVPIHLVQSSIERTGKGLLISSILGALVGGHIPSVQVGEREEEREKRFTTLILEGATIVHLDNLPGSSVLDSASLAALATAPVWKGRVLGSSSMPTLPNTLTLVASANNLRTSSEIAKRIVPIWLEPATSSPETRDDFLHPDIAAYAQSARPAVLATLLGMIDAWIGAGRPRGRVRLGGFEDWAATIGGILETQGVDCWMAQRAEWAAGADEWGAHLDILVAAWAAELPSQVTAGDLLKLAERLDLFPDVLNKPEGKARETAFGSRVLKRLIDRPVLTYKIRKDRNQRTFYTLISKEEPTLDF